MTTTTEDEKPPSDPSPNGLVWRQMTFNQMVTSEEALSAMEHLASATEIGASVLEMRARSGAAPRWYVAAGPPHVRDLGGLMTSHLPAHVFPLTQSRTPLDVAARVRLTGRNPRLEPGNMEQAIRSLFGLFSSLDVADELCLQLLLGRRHSPPLSSGPTWGVLVDEVLVGNAPRRAKTGSARDGRHRHYQHGFDASLRIAAKASTPDRARHLIRQVRSCLRVLEAAGSQIALDNIAASKIQDGKRPWRWTLRIASSEAAALTGWPVGDGELPTFGQGHPKRLAPPSDLPTSGRVIGASAAPGFEGTRIKIPIQSAASHSHILAPTGAGKSTVLLNLIRSDIEAGRSVVVIDPKGDLATDVLGYIPDGRRDDVVIIDGSSECTVGLNPMASVPGQEAQMADQLLGILESMDDRPWGVGVRQTFSTAVHTLARAPRASLLHLVPLLTDTGFRHRLLAQVDDHTGLEFWQQFEAMSAEQQSQSVLPVLRRLQPIHLRPALRGILGQTEPRFQMKDLFTSRKILVVNLNKGLIGADPARIIGSLVVGMLWQHTLTRQRISPERRHIVTTYIDEAQEFIHGLGSARDLADILAQARSLGLALHLANQHLGQFTPALQDVILANARNRLYLPLSDKDARTIAKTTSGLDAADFTLLPAYHAQLQMMHKGQQSRWMTVKLDPVPAQLSDPAPIYAHAQQRYGVPVSTVEDQLRQQTAAKSPRTKRPPNGDDLGLQFGGRSR